MKREDDDFILTRLITALVAAIVLLGIGLLLRGCDAHAAEPPVLLWRDYNLTDEVYRPVSVGVASWTSPDYGTRPALYGQVACATYYELRLSLGAIVTVADRLVAKPLTAVCHPIGERIELGVYYTPFWGLDDRFDDPYGVMIGYMF